MLKIPNVPCAKWINQFVSSKVFLRLIRTALKVLLDTLLSYNNRETLKATRMIFKTELVMPRTVAGFRLYNMMFAYSLCT